MTEIVPLGLPDPTPYLLPEETVRLVVRRHHPIVLAPAAAFVVAAVIVVAIWMVNTDVTSGGAIMAAVIVGAAALYFLYRYVHWSRTVLVITNRRLFQLVSLGIRRVTVMPVMRQAIVFKQSPIGRALDFGTVQVRTATGSVLYSFDWLADPTRFRDEITNIAA